MGAAHHSSFQSLFFPKTGEEIKAACLAKAANLEKRVKRREATIREALTSNDLDALDVMKLMKGTDELFSNNFQSGHSAGPGYASNASLLEAKKHLKAADWGAVEGENARLVDEVNEIQKLKTIAANIGLTEIYRLPYSDVEYFEFGF